MRVPLLAAVAVLLTLPATADALYGALVTNENIAAFARETGPSSAAGTVLMLNNKNPELNRFGFAENPCGQEAGRILPIPLEPDDAGVAAFSGRIPRPAATIAESFRSAGEASEGSCSSVERLETASADADGPLVGVAEIKSPRDSASGQATGILVLRARRSGASVRLSLVRRPAARASQAGDEAGTIKFFVKAGPHGPRLPLRCSASAMSPLCGGVYQKIEWTKLRTLAIGSGRSTVAAGRARLYTAASD